MLADSSSLFSTRVRIGRAFEGSFFRPVCARRVPSRNASGLALTFLITRFTSLWTSSPDLPSRTTTRFLPPDFVAASKRLHCLYPSTLLQAMSEYGPLPQFVQRKYVTSKPTPEAGNGLFAVASIALSEPILEIRRPLTQALDTARLKDTCYHCLKLAEKGSVMKDDEKGQGKILRACTGCGIVRYCNKVTTALPTHALLTFCRWRLLRNWA